MPTHQTRLGSPGISAQFHPPCTTTWAATLACTSPCSLEGAPRGFPPDCTSHRLTYCSERAPRRQQGEASPCRGTDGCGITGTGAGSLINDVEALPELRYHLRLSPHGLDQTREQSGCRNQGSDGHGLSPARIQDSPPDALGLLTKSPQFYLPPQGFPNPSLSPAPCHDTVFFRMQKIITAERA